MSAAPTARTTIVTDTIAHLYAQFQGDPVMGAFVAGAATECQELEYVFISLLVDQVLANAEGVQLDKIGRVLGEGRRGRSDSDYRAGLLSWIVALGSDGRIDEIIAILESYETGLYEVYDPGLGYLQVRFVGAIGSIDTDLLNTVLQIAKAAGIRADFIYSEEADSDTFTLADGDVVQTDANKGAANDAGTVGGSVTEVEV